MNCELSAQMSQQAFICGFYVCQEVNNNRTQTTRVWGEWKFASKSVETVWDLDSCY